MADTTSDDGYESDTGARDNPAAWNFQNEEPVKPLIGRQVGRRFRLLNRQGRAICRIVHAHRWRPTDIAKIFGLETKPIGKAIGNNYVPADGPQEDYDHVGADFLEAFPPQQWDGKQIAGGKRAHPEGDEEEEGPTQISNKQATLSKIPPKPRNDKAPPSKSDVPIPNRDGGRKRRAIANKQAGASTSVQAPAAQSIPTGARAQPESLLTFLKNVMGMDLSAHVVLFQEKGFTDVGILRTIGRLSDADLRGMLRRLLVGDGSNKGLSDLELEMLELALRKLS
ncbi:hypothetical protein B0H14DRAFT_2815424 [Mycena olivaceomarginata]|nr:hypothetical protein B0H14DRAFT_2815424 [Mycena olivaceomarginata]